MKKLFIVLFGISFLCSCLPHRDCCALQFHNQFSAQKNGVSWLSVLSKAWFDTDQTTLNIIAKTLNQSVQPYAYADSLHLQLLDHAVGTHPLKGGQASYSTLLSGATNTYMLDTTFNNVVNITSYTVVHNPATTNPDQVKMLGTFSLRFTDPHNAAGLIFSAGNFDLVFDQ
jgi:hypothetical protein